MNAARAACQSIRLHDDVAFPVRRKAEFRYGCSENRDDGRSHRNGKMKRRAVVANKKPGSPEKLRGLQEGKPAGDVVHPCVRRSFAQYLLTKVPILRPADEYNRNTIAGKSADQLSVALFGPSLGVPDRAGGDGRQTRVWNLQSPQDFIDRFLVKRRRIKRRKLLPSPGRPQSVQQFQVPLYLVKITPVRDNGCKKPPARTSVKPDARRDSRKPDEQRAAKRAMRDKGNIVVLFPETPRQPHEPADSRVFLPLVEFYDLANRGMVAKNGSCPGDCDEIDMSVGVHLLRNLNERQRENDITEKGSLDNKDILGIIHARKEFQSLPSDSGSDL